MRRSLLAALVLASGAAFAVVPATVGLAPAATAQTTGSTYTAVTPVRVLDTRNGAGPVGPGGTVTLDLAGRLPAGATAVVMNVTGVAPTADTFVTAYPHGVSRPGASNLNLAAGETRANLVTVAVGADRAVDLYNKNGSTHLVVDVAGYYSTGAGARYMPRESERVLSTRLGHQATATLDLSRWVPTSATAVVLNVTVAQPTTSTFVTAWPYGTARPGTSTVNLAQGATNANLTTVALGSGRRVSLYNNAGDADVHVDFAGFYTPEYGALFTPVTPKRVLDTRNGTGVDGGATSPVGADRFFPLRAEGLPDEAIAAVVNMTGTQPTSATFLTVRQSSGSPYTNTSTLNVAPGQTVANLAVAATTDEAPYARTFVYNRNGNVHVVADLMGWFSIPKVPCPADCLYTWGNNDGGRGVGTTTSDVSTPEPVSGLTGVTDVTGQFAIRSDGTVWGWGTNQFGDLGAGWIGGQSTTPLRVTGLTNVVQVAGTGTGALALRSDGTVWGWGGNPGGVLGSPGLGDTSAPIRVAGLTDVRALATGYYNAYAVRADGTVWSWGNNEFGTLGTGSTAYTGTPARVPGLTGVTAISANITNVYAVRDDGTVWAWGSNTTGQLGSGSTAALSRTPVRVAGLTGVRSVHAGDSGLMGQGVAHAVRADGSVWSWGQNDLGQLGADSTAAFSRAPVQVPGLTGVTEILPGESVYVLRADGSVWGWGDNFANALAHSSSVPVPRPVRIPLPAAVVDLDVRRALDGDGRVWTWGYNGHGDLGIGHSFDVGARIEQAQLPVATKLLAGHAVVPTP